MNDFALPPADAEDACGPDLDMEGDAEFLNYLATMEQQLPASYFSFDRKSIDFPAALEAGEKLLQRTLDVRLLLVLAKLSILNRDLNGFIQRVGEIAWLLSTHWEEAHPRADGGDYSARLAQLGTLDDGPVVVLPLQYAPLVEARRDGVLVYRAQMIAMGDAKPREGETLPSAGAIERILLSVEPERLESAIAGLESLRQSLAAIYRLSVEHVGFENAVDFKQLNPLVARILGFLNEARLKRDPGAAASATDEPEAEARAEGGAPAAARPPDSFASLSEVDAALAAALGYFQANEPSSPALLLILQARESLGKDLYAVMQLLAPQHADNARVFVGPDGAFTVQVRSLSNASTPEIERSAPEPAPSRQAALAIVDAVASHMRKAEPSSPAPFLLERARALASRDFLSLLHELLPEDDLDSMKRGR